MTSSQASSLPPSTPVPTPKTRFLPRVRLGRYMPCINEDFPGSDHSPPLLPSSVQSIWQAASLSPSPSPSLLPSRQMGAHFGRVGHAAQNLYHIHLVALVRTVAWQRWRDISDIRERGESVRGPGSDTAATSILPPQSTSWATPQNVLAQQCHSAAGRTELLRYFLSDKMARWGNRICTEMPSSWQKFETSKFALCPKVLVNTLCIRRKIHKA